MIIPIDRATLASLKNPQFAAYAAVYLDIRDDFMAQVRSTGMEIDPQPREAEIARRLQRLRRKGATFRNNGKSIYINAISSACVACQKGVGSATFFISLMCDRNCWFCFNSNEQHYDIFSRRKRDCIKELAEIHEAGLSVHQIGLTGGEPLLHKAETLAFLHYAAEKFPAAYTRLYTCGDYLDDATLQQLADAKLDEIRFSIKNHDLRQGRCEVFDQIAQAKTLIPFVMVEMPIIPGTVDEMKEALLTLDRLGVFSINLLEFCFPFHNAKTFRAKGLRIRNPIYRVLYNYDYAGGLPIAGSEAACLELLEYALDEGLDLGVHYCSLENKFTAQIYQQNAGHPLPKNVCFSHKDYFLKTAKVFGRDIPPALRILRKRGTRPFAHNPDGDYLAFHVRDVRALRHLDVEVGLCSSVLEDRPGGRYLRELQVDLTYPRQFDMATDV